MRLHFNLFLGIEKFLDANKTSWACMLVVVYFDADDYQLHANNTICICLLAIKSR